MLEHIQHRAKTDPGSTREPDNSTAIEVAKLVEQGITETPYAWHGTSVEAVLYLAEHGVLPSSGSYGSEFFMAPEELPGDQKDHGEHYAEWNAMKAYVAQHIPFIPQDPERFMYAMDRYAGHSALEEFIKEECLPRGITERDLKRLMVEGSGRKGALLGISAEVSTDFPEGAYVDADQKSVLIPEGGLSLRYITGIEPLGRYEWDQLVALQEKVAK